MLFKKAKKEEPIQEVALVDTQDNQSASLKGFRETLKDVLEDITSLEVSTIIVSNISTDKFDARAFYEDITYSFTYKTGDFLLNKHIELSEKAEALRKKGASISPEEHSDYIKELDAYKKLQAKFDQAKFDTYKKSLAEFPHRFEQEQKYYGDVCEQFSKLDFEKHIKNGRFEPDASTTRFLRKLWETEQTIIHCDRIYAQTRFQLDGDLSNRFVNELFGINNSKNSLTPETAKLVLEIHNKALENAESQWSKLINTAVDLVTKLIPYRK